MIVSSLSDAALLAAENAYEDISVRIAGNIPSWDITLGRQQINLVSKFVKQNAEALGDISFAIELCQSAGSDKKKLEPKDIQNAQGKNLILQIDPELRLLAYDKPDKGWDCSKESVEMSRLSKGRIVAYYEGRTSMFYFCDKELIALVDPRSDAKPAGKQGRHRRQAVDYQLSILDHYRNEVKDPGKACDHWQDHSKRILRCSLGKAAITEDIFLHSLLRWLNENLEGRVTTKAGLITQDETDIEISSLSSCAVIEIKWLGTNEKKTKRQISRVSSGIKQLATYLKKGGSLNSGVIVAYDGRPEAMFEAIPNALLLEEGAKRLSECEKVKIPVRGDCLVLFLKSLTGSTV